MGLEKLQREIGNRVVTITLICIEIKIKKKINIE
jgi:hypothetical protein